MARVLVLGNAGLDISLAVPRLPERGETLLGDGVSHAPGGKGLNQAVTAARTGILTRFHAPVGRDAQAEEIRSALSVEASLEFDPAPLDHPSDFSLLMVMPDGENSIVSGGPCATSFSASAATDFAVTAEAGDVVVLQGNLTQEATLAALKAASDRGVTTLLNPAPLWWEVGTASALLDDCRREQGRGRGDYRCGRSRERSCRASATRRVDRYHYPRGGGLPGAAGHDDCALPGDAGRCEGHHRLRRYILRRSRRSIDDRSHDRQCDRSGPTGGGDHGNTGGRLCRLAEQAGTRGDFFREMKGIEMTIDVANPLLDIGAMSVALGPAGRRVTVVDRLSVTIDRGRILCVVGESGSGKSVFAMSLMRLISEDICVISADHARLEGEELTDLSERDMLRLRGGKMAMIFQEPMTSLNPVFTIGDQIAEAVRLHQGLSSQAGRQKALAALKQVHIPAAERRLDSYPHELSGGMRQRVMIAMALACEPSLLIADEPTTALDVTIQAQILALLAELRDRTGMGILFITHNLGVVAEIADDVAVMYAGRIVERAPAATLFADAQHPYTLALLAAMPHLDGHAERLEPIPGRMPPPWEATAGCRFAPRCPFADAICSSSRPYAPSVIAMMSPAGARRWRALHE